MSFAIDPSPAGAIAHVELGVGTANEIVGNLEGSYPVNQLRYGDLRIWPVLRTGLLFYFGQARGFLAEPPGGPILTKPKHLAQLLSIIEPRVHALPDSFAGLTESSNSSGLKARQPADILFIGRKESRAVMIDGRAFDPQLDPLIAAVDGRISWQKLLIAYGAVPDQPTYFRRTAMDLATYLHGFSKFFELAEMLLPQRKQAISGWEDMLQVLPQLKEVPLPPKPAVLHGYFRGVEGVCGVIMHALDIFQPKLVVFVGQNATTFAAALACYRRGIACVDIQHGSGATSDTNLKWFGWKQVPPGGYELLPDYFFVWNNDAAQRIEGTMGGALGHHRPIVGGNPWLGSYETFVPRPQRTRDESNNDALRILVTLTQQFAGRIPEHVVEAMARGPKTWEWLVRIHPEDVSDPGNLAAVAETLSKHQLSDVKLEGPSRAPLPELLGSVDRHITQYSSTCMEATAFGLGTIFTDRRAAQFFPQLVKQPGFTVALTCDELLRALRNPPNRDTPMLVNPDPNTGLHAIKQMLSGGPIRKRPTW